MSDRLAGLYPPFADRCRTIEAQARAAFVRIRWTSGVRSFEEQAALYARGRNAQGAIVDPKRVVTRARPGWSAHNYGLGADFGLVRPDGSTFEWSGLADLDADGIVDWLEVGRMAESLGLVWGGRWRKMMDMPHVEWPSLDYARLLAWYAGAGTGGGRGVPAVWAALDRMQSGVA